MTCQAKPNQGMDVYLTSPWVPPEWIKAHGLVPRGIWCAPGFAFDTSPLTAGVCAFAQATVRLAQSQIASAFVFTSNCDQLRRGFDVATGNFGRVFLFNLPATWQTPVGQRMYLAEMERLGAFLVRLGGCTPSADEVLAFCGQYRQSRGRLLESAQSTTGRSYAEAVARFHWDGSASPAEPVPFRIQDFPLSERNLAQWEKGTGGSSDRNIPLALVGGPLPRPHWGLLDLIEHCGGKVVLNATEAGERSLPTPTAGASSGQMTESSHADPVRSVLTILAREFIEGCVEVFQRPNTRLYSWLATRLKARRVRGIMLWHYVGCDLWRAEAQSLREAFGLPLLALDANEAAADSLAYIGRVQAFLEGLK
jgi:benzoyl-CoA reductase/2-hydroxyglutaryl-CoA dehydratase subunit BcrC/BadD/HgdB